MQEFYVKLDGNSDIADLIKGVNPKETIENIELRAVIELRVEAADLNVTTKMALNKKFYPDGGGDFFSKPVNKNS